MVALYLYDSTLLLSGNEALLSVSRNGRWVAFFGSDNFQIRSREPFLPNPFLPHRPLYRFCWNTEGFVGASRPWSPPGGSYAILAPFIWCMMLALFVVIPLGLFTRLSNVAIAFGLILFYFNILILLTIIWFRRADYELTGHRFASLAVECLTSPPFALNIVRRLSLGFQLVEDFLTVVDQYLEGPVRSDALNRAAIRVKHEIDWEDEGTLRAKALNSHLQYLTRESSSCQTPNS